MPLNASVYARLPTERPNPRTRGIDLKTPLQIVRIINREDALVARAVAREAPRLARAVEAVTGALEKGGRLLFVGAGTSGRLGVLEAAECPPTFNTSPKMIRAVMAGGKMSVFKSKEGAEDSESAGVRAVRGYGRGDVVVGIAASGVTVFARAALKTARKKGCRTILVTSNGRPPGAPAEFVIAPAVGPEVVTGSTRMKSGTAAKLVLNALTTAAMIRLGKVHDHWMVDLRPASRKLRLRSERIVVDLGGIGSARARALLKKAQGSVKIAVLMARLGVGVAEARRRLKRCGGRLRRALK